MQSATPDASNSTPRSPTPVGTPGPRKASMTLINFWLDAALLVAVIVLVWTSVMMQVVFPPPTDADGWRVWGLSYNQWHTLQFVALCVAALLALEHVVLHWTWICSVLATRILHATTRPDEGNQAIYGLGTFVTILVLSMATIIAAMLGATPPPNY